MPAPEIRRDQWEGAAKATRSPRPDLPSPGAVLGSFVALIDHLLAAETRLFSSDLRIGSSAAHRSRPAARTATTPHPGPEDDQRASASAPSDPSPAPATDAIAARAYEIFVQRGHEPGNPVDDWRRAEAELRADVTG